MLEFTYGGNREGKKGKRDIGHEVALVEKYIKGKSGARERMGPLKDQQGHLCLEPQEMGEMLN